MKHSRNMRSVELLAESVEEEIVVPSNKIGLIIRLNPLLQKAVAEGPSSKGIKNKYHGRNTNWNSILK